MYKINVERKKGKPFNTPRHTSDQEYRYTIKLKECVPAYSGKCRGPGTKASNHDTDFQYVLKKNLRTLTLGTTDFRLHRLTVHQHRMQMISLTICITKMISQLTLEMGGRRVKEEHVERNNRNVLLRDMERNGTCSFV